MISGANGNEGSGNGTGAGMEKANCCCTSVLCYNVHRVGVSFNSFSRCDNNCALILQNCVMIPSHFRLLAFQLPRSSNYLEFACLHASTVPTSSENLLPDKTEPRAGITMSQQQLSGVHYPSRALV